MSPAQRGMLHLAVVYAVWGSTFLAIRVAAQAFPPFTLSAMRVLGGAVLLFAIVAATRKQNLRVDRRTLATLALSGVTLWAGGHAALLYGAQRADAGYAAVVFGTTPIWSLLITSIRTQSAPKAKLMFFTALGFAGIVVLTLPSLIHNARDPNTGLDPWTVLALIAAPIGWALGSTFQPKREVPALASAAYQQLAGGIACAAIALAFEETSTTIQPTTEAYLAWLYLIVPGLIPAFTSYVRALQLLPESRVMTFAYVNPMIAVVLGAWLLDETITPLTIAGMAILLAGVAGIQTSQGFATSSPSST